jgi:hypothetical protein
MIKNYAALSSARCLMMIIVVPSLALALYPLSCQREGLALHPLSTIVHAIATQSHHGSLRQGNIDDRQHVRWIQSTYTYIQQNSSRLYFAPTSSPSLLLSRPTKQKNKTTTKQKKTKTKKYGRRNVRVGVVRVGVVGVVGAVLLHMRDRPSSLPRRRRRRRGGG